MGVVSRKNAYLLPPTLHRWRCNRKSPDVGFCHTCNCPCVLHLAYITYLSTLGWRIALFSDKLLVKMRWCAQKVRKDLALLFLNTSRRNDAAWMWSSCRSDLRQGTSGYTKLCTHIRYHQLNELPHRILKARKCYHNIFNTIWYPLESIAAYGWIDCIVMCLVPLFCWKHSDAETLQERVHVQKNIHVAHAQAHMCC